MGLLKIPKFNRRMQKRTAPGSPPGTLQPAANLPKPTIERIVYDEDGIVKETFGGDDIERLLTPVPGKKIWLDIRGLGDTDFIQAVGHRLGLHLLTLEDIVHVQQRPKHEEHDAYLFWVLRALRVLEDESIDNEQISFVLKDHLLVTFQERPGDVFEPVRKRLCEGKGTIRKKGIDYLLYALVDAVIDNYYPVLEAYESSMDLLDDQVRQNPTPEVSRLIHSVRRQLRRFRRSISPLRDTLNNLIREESDFIDDSVRVYFRDCYDHIIHVSEFIEGNRERADDLGDLYMSVVSEKTNQVMNLLTIIATIFIPLTFLCGVYGMNFDTEASPYNMPELKWRYAYPAFWGVLLVIFTGMVVYFRRKGWLATKKKPTDE